MQVDVYRTPEDRFADLPGFRWEPRFREWDGLRLAHLDEGSGEPVVLLHGEPTWSYLWRKVMNPLLDELDLREVTLVMQDWGGPIGLRVAALERPERISRLVAMDTGVFTGHQRMSDGWHRFAAFVERNPDLPIGLLVSGGCKHPPPDDVVAAYEAPFPDERSKAGPRTFPPMIPLSPNERGAAEGQAVAEVMQRDERPSLLMWADSDPALPLEPMGRQVQALFPTAEELTVIEEAGHFLQEDRGEQVGALIADWLRTQAA